jgi:alkylated DNA repair protein alkB family protein 8
VKHYGYQFRYETNDVNVNEPMKEEIPSYLEKVVLRMVEGGVFKDKPDQLTVNQYAPGSGTVLLCYTICK